MRKRGVPYINTTRVYFCRLDWNCQERLTYIRSQCHYVIQKIDNFQYSSLKVDKIQFPGFWHWRTENDIRVYTYTLSVAWRWWWWKTWKGKQEGNKFTWFFPSAKSIFSQAQHFAIFYSWRTKMYTSCCFFMKWLCWVVGAGEVNAVFCSLSARAQASCEFWNYHFSPISTSILIAVNVI